MRGHNVCFYRKLSLNYPFLSEALISADEFPRRDNGTRIQITSICGSQGLQNKISQDSVKFSKLAVLQLLFVVVLLFYIHGIHLRSCRGQLT